VSKRPRGIRKHYVVCQFSAAGWSLCFRNSKGDLHCIWTYPTEREAWAEARRRQANPRLPF